MTGEMAMFIVIVRDAQNRIISRIGHVDWEGDRMEAMAIARARLREKRGAVRAEVHYFETAASLYEGKPLAVFTVDDMTDEERAGQFE